MIRIAISLAVVLLAFEIASAGPPKIDWKIRKEPVYQTKTPKYGMLMFGMEGQDRVWLVQDGDTLYVDRNGDGDLTEPGKKVLATKSPGQTWDEDGYTFEVGDVTVGGRAHKNLTVYFNRLERFAAGPRGKGADVKQALAKDEQALVVTLKIDADLQGLRGNGLDGRAVITAGWIDLNGILQFASTPDKAPVVWFGGPLEVTFPDELPTLRVGRERNLVLVVGTPGMGPGTFGKLYYEKTIPEDAKPVAELTLPAKTGLPLKETFELKERC
jgi:hypothetical protein